VRRAAALAVGALLAAASAARAEKPEVTARLVVPASAPAGSRVPIAVELTVGKGWHVNSHTPAEKFLIPTDLALAASTGTLSAVRYPRDVEIRPAFADAAMRVYEGTVRFECDLDLPPDARSSARVTGSLSFQACNDRQCFAPAKIALEGSISLGPPH